MKITYLNEWKKVLKRLRAEAIEYGEGYFPRDIDEVELKLEVIEETDWEGNDIIDFNIHAFHDGEELSEYTYKTIPADDDKAGGKLLYHITQNLEIPLSDF